ncbi:MAG: helix-turn-helix domain-containing protein [Hyphomicrobium sp.]
MLNAIDKNATDLIAASSHDDANAALGFRFVRALAVEKAALDRDLPHACVRVIAAICYFMNGRNRRAWPSYARISEVTGYSTDTIERAIRQLRDGGYLFTERRSPITGGRALVHYGLGTIEPADIDRMIAAAVDALRRNEPCANADPGKNAGVRLTPAKMPGWRSDPGKSPASDPGILPPQEPFKNEPKGETRERDPGRASRSGSEVEISAGVRHLTDACIAQRFGNEPKGHALTRWQHFLDTSPQCRQLSNAEADELASVIVAAGERFWPAAAAIRDVVEKRAQKMAAREAYIQRHRELLPLREAYLSDVCKLEEIENGLPRIDHDGKPDWRARHNERAKTIEALKAAAGIDMSRHRPEVSGHDFREPPSHPIGFSWPMPERRKAGGSHQ